MEITKLNYGKDDVLKAYIKSESPLRLKSNNKQILDLPIFEDILKNTNPEYSDKARCYLFIMNKFEITCGNEGCSNIVKFDNYKNTFRQFCSVKCRNQDTTLRKQISKKWNDVKKDALNKKIKETCVKKYGVENVMQTEDAKQKIKKTCLKKYGVEYTTQTLEMKQKSKETCLEKYGVEHAWQDPSIRQKATNTTIKRMGVENVNQKHFKNFDKWSDVAYIKTNFLDKNNRVLMRDMATFFNCHIGTCSKHLRSLNIEYTADKGSVSEREIIDYIENELKVDILCNDRELIAPYELDILSKSNNVAIEFNGLYWHSYGLNNTNDRQNNLAFNKKRHLNKTNACNKKNVQLFHIFENEWLDDNTRDIWKAQLSNAFKKNTISIGARKCTIVELDTKVSNDFLQNNHLQGACVSSIKLGLVYENELLSVMTFGKSRYDKNIDYELIRFCSKKYVQVPGAASRLLKYFEKTYSPKGLVSYANARWSTGHLYKTIGFTLAGVSHPNYFYYHELTPDVLRSRVSFQKHKLKNKLKTFDENKTEMQNMIENGYRAIYDSGNYKFIKKY